MTMTNMVRVELGGETREVNESEWKAVADELHAKHGGIPVVTRLGDPPPATGFRATCKAIGPTGFLCGGALPCQWHPADPAELPRTERPRGLTFVAPRATPKPAPTVARGITVDEEGRARSQGDAEAAVAMGFAPAQPYFEEGTMLLEEGVERARRARLEWERMPAVRDYCESFIARIGEEEREDVEVQWSLLSMQRDGGVVLPTPIPEVVRVSVDAIGPLSSLLGMYRAGGYLTRTWPELRAHNVNEYRAQKLAHEAKLRQELEAAGKGKNFEPHTGVARIRSGSGDEREAFAFVSKGYAALDVDKIAEAIKLAAPEEARGRVSYDGRRARFEVLYHSNVEPEKFVAGEFFRAGVVVTTDDTGGGALRGWAVVHRNLCLNLLLIDKSTAGLFSVRHTGSVEEMADKFRAGFERAHESLDHFRKAWGFAVEEDALARAREAADEDAPLDIREAMPWLFNGLIERELVPVFARRPEAVRGLMEAWDREPEPTRAAVVNAVTRYAHEIANVDPWREDEIQRAAGRLLYGRGARSPAPFPLVNPDSDDD